MYSRKTWVSEMQCSSWLGCWLTAVMEMEQCDVDGWNFLLF